jgi:hypothetical protein
MDLRLSFEFIPAPCRGQNLHALLPRSEWDAIRRQVYASTGHHCAACGASGLPLQANEQWEYDDARRVQRLVGLICLCERCHAVAHSNWTQGVRRFTQAELRAHFCRINGCSETEYARLRSHALAWWQERCHHGPWTTDFGPYAACIAHRTTTPTRRDGATPPGIRSASPEVQP